MVTQWLSEDATVFTKLNFYRLTGRMFMFLYYNLSA